MMVTDGDVKTINKSTFMRVNRDDSPVTITEQFYEAFSQIMAAENLAAVSNGHSILEARQHPITEG